MVTIQCLEFGGPDVPKVNKYSVNAAAIYFHLIVSNQAKTGPGKISKFIHWHIKNSDSSKLRCCS